MNRFHQSIATLFFAASIVTTAQAQVGPEEAVRKIAEEVAEEMKAIDRLLLESSRTKDALQRLEQNADRLRELIDQTQTSQDKVVRGIDNLIDELQKMAQQQSQSSSSQQQDQQQQGGQPQERDGQSDPRSGQPQQGTRREIDTPDLAQQGEQPQPGQQQDQQGDPRGDTPNDNQRDPNDPGANRPGGTPVNDGSEQVERASDAERWGDLQKYVPPQYQRAGVPEVPAKYRRLHEAFQKRASTSGSQGGR